MSAKPRKRTTTARRRRRRGRRTPWYRATQPSFLTIGVVALALAGAVYVWPDVRSRLMPADRPAGHVPAVAALPQAVPPAPTERDSRPSDTYRTWARGLSGKLDIPAVALQAYAYAQVTTARTHPHCHLSWTLLAGIGRIESNHGRYGGATLRADGTSSPRIIGVPLNGGPGLMTISDTDNGRLDGDRRYDRAVGPMQFIPSTWARSGVDGDGDGRADPFDIDDASMAAARYLCAGGRDVSTSQGWSQAVLSYNHTGEYLRSVYGYADGYAHASL
jgi:membrane-bound lytic murein transglycosylase B